MLIDMRLLIVKLQSMINENKSWSEIKSNVIQLYRLWLRAAYRYYWSKLESDMSDADWDFASKLLGEIKHMIPDEDKHFCAILFHKKFEPGQSLFYLNRDEYPLAIQVTSYKELSELMN